MPFTEEEKQKIIEVVQQKSPKAIGVCPMCGKNEWSLADGLVFFVLQDGLRALRVGGTGLPCIAMTCTTCGNTYFLNVLILGLQSLIERKEIANAPK